MQHHHQPRRGREREREEREREEKGEREREGGRGRKREKERAIIYHKNTSISPFSPPLYDKQKHKRERTKPNLIKVDIIIITIYCRPNQTKSGLSFDFKLWKKYIYFTTTEWACTCVKFVHVWPQNLQMKNSVPKTNTNRVPTGRQDRH